MYRSIVLAALVGVSSCAIEPAYLQPTSYEIHLHQHDAIPLASTPAATMAAGDASRVIVIQGQHLDRPSEVLGLIDVHMPMGGEEEALAALRARAAAMGADAVVGAEFHHGERHDRPTHLSGMAVRFVSIQ